MLSEQRIRGVLFYASVAVFFVFLPFVLSSALGYRFDRRNFKFTRSGLIFIKTQPAGASVYLNGKLLNDKTPVTINELLPGRYRIRLELERYYPWSDEVTVEAGKATPLDKIILFLLRPNVKQVNRDRFNSFWIDEERQAVYYISKEENALYKSDLAGERYQKLADLIGFSTPALKYKISFDRNRILYCNNGQLAVTDINPDDRFHRGAFFVINEPDSEDWILDAFWHSDGYHIITVRKNHIDVIEARPGAKAVALTRLNNKNTSAFYDVRNDTLYFLDLEEAADGNTYDNLYKIELSPWIFPWQDLIKRRHNEAKP
ncbi:MAG: PEGA domain-containing protein [Candidatus Omnitrophota bacterium]